LVLPLKKTLKASEQEREDIINARQEWKKFQETINPENIVFLDESGIKTNMTRIYGRSYQGTRCYDSTPNGHWETLTVLSSIRLNGKTECIIFDGAVDRKMFDEYIKQILAPTLRPGDILIMDNLSAHKSRICEKIVSSQGAQVKFLPAYSPDFNPIENMWSKLKQILRGIKARTNEELLSSVGVALDMVTQSDAKGWFGDCGYV
jgi:transposase